MLDEHGHELYPEDETLLLQIRSMVTSIWRGLHGHKEFGQKGLIQDFATFRMEVELKIKELELRVLQVEQSNKKWLIWVTAFGVGVMVATGIYFGLTLKQIKGFLN